MQHVTLCCAKKYVNTFPGIEKALAFLQGPGGALAPGEKVAIDGEAVFAMASAYTTGPAAEKPYETHDRYIDVQFMVKGRERIFFCRREKLAGGVYNAQNDISFYETSGEESSIILEAGDIALIFPEEGHKPGCRVAEDTAESVHKIVVKVAVDNLLP